MAWGGRLYFDHNCILPPILETLLFSQGPDKDSDKNENSFLSLVSANMATHSDLGMTFLLTRKPRLMVTNEHYNLTWTWAYASAERFYISSLPQKAVVNLWEIQWALVYTEISFINPPWPFYFESQKYNSATLVTLPEIQCMYWGRGWVLQTEPMPPKLQFNLIRPRRHCSHDYFHYSKLWTDISLKTLFF